MSKGFSFGLIIFDWMQWAVKVILELDKFYPEFIPPLLVGFNTYDWFFFILIYSFRLTYPIIDCLKLLYFSSLKLINFSTTFTINFLDFLYT